MSDAEFCTNCGTTIFPGPNTGSVLTSSNSSRGKKIDGYNNWRKSLPFTLGACLFLLIIDLLTSNGVDWSYWAIIPILIFAIVAPYFSFKINPVQV